MKRLDTMHAVRHIIGAGTLAVAIVAAAAQPAAAQNTCDQFSEGGVYPAICGFVFTDSVQPGDGAYQPGEGVGNVTVFVTKLDGTPVNSSVVDCTGIDPCGLFTFGDWPDGDGNYLFCIVTATNTQENCAMRTDSTPVAVTLGSNGFYTEIELVPPQQQSGPGTGTPGYWKNHPTIWPAQVTVGSVTYLTKGGVPPADQKTAIQYMGKVSGDKTLSMFAALISAKLNLWAGTNPSCIQTTVDLANDWMKVNPVGSGVKASSQAWSADSDSSGSALHQALDDYNNGRLCAPHRD